MPEAPWIMTQSWHDLLFAHWPVDHEELRAKVPPGFSLDLYDGQAWIGVVPFRMTNVAPRGVPALPWVSAFAELNVRTYVKVGDRPGVYFFSLDADSAIAVAAARSLFHSPYYTAQMAVREDRGAIHYTSRRTAPAAESADFIARYRPIGPAYEAPPGSLDYFLTERYCLYNVDNRFRARRLEIHHRPWHLHRAEAAIDTNTITTAAGIRLPTIAPLYLDASVPRCSVTVKIRLIRQRPRQYLCGRDGLTNMPRRMLCRVKQEPKHVGRQSRAADSSMIQEPIAVRSSQLIEGALDRCTGLAYHVGQPRWRIPLHCLGSKRCLLQIRELLPSRIREKAIEGSAKMASMKANRRGASWSRPHVLDRDPQGELFQIFSSLNECVSNGHQQWIDPFDRSAHPDFRLWCSGHEPRV